MNTYKITLYLFFISMIAACAPPLQGALIDSRDYYTINSMDDDGAFASYTAMCGNRPAGILTDDGDLYYLAIQSDQLAPYALETLKVKGKKNNHQRLILPNKIWLQKDSKWQQVKLK